LFAIHRPIGDVITGLQVILGYLKWHAVLFYLFFIYVYIAVLAMSHEPADKISLLITWFNKPGLPTARVSKVKAVQKKKNLANQTYGDAA